MHKHKRLRNIPSSRTTTRNVFISQKRKQILFSIRMHGYILQGKQSLRVILRSCSFSSSPTILSLSYDLPRKGVVPRTVAWYAKICDKGGWSICVRVVMVTCTCTYVLLVCVDVCGYGKASGNPIRIEAPGGLMEKKERTTDQPRPEYRMSGIFISRCHSWKVASFFWKILL